MVKIQSYYNRNQNAGFVCQLPSRTKPEFQQQADINWIVKKWMTDGVWPGRPSFRKPEFGDFTSGLDYQKLVERIATVDAYFSDLPADIREEFQNDPGQLLDFLSDPENRDEAIEMGLLPELQNAQPADLPGQELMPFENGSKPPSKAQNEPSKSDDEPSKKAKSSTSDHSPT